MRTALVTTTINVPTVLKLYRKLGPDVAFFVAGDLKTPPEAAMGSDAPHFMSAEYQKSLGYKCSELIGWNCIQRRNIAILEALKYGADIIVSLDDDNIALGGYFFHFQGDLTHEKNGIKVTGLNKWFDVGQLLAPIAPHRGFPHTVNPAWRADPVTDAKVGVAAGVCLGNPDISAVERIANYPTVHTVSELLRSGIVVDNKTWTVFNSQNTAFLRMFAPAMLLCPQFKRYDDIVASLVCQRVMREHGYHVHFGLPLVFQQRNAHNLVRDLKDELWGMENLETVAAWLDEAELTAGATVMELVRGIYYAMSRAVWAPPGIGPLAEAWLEDCAQVMQ